MSGVYVCRVYVCNNGSKGRDGLPAGVVFIIITTAIANNPLVSIAIYVPADGTVSLGAALVALAVAAGHTVINVHTGRTGGFLADDAEGGGVAVDMSTATRKDQVRLGEVGSGKVRSDQVR